MTTLLVGNNLREQALGLAEEAERRYILEGSDSVGIGEIRQLGKSLSLKGSKTVIILEAGRLTSEASNALLKTLEEPGQDTKIILTAKSEFELLPTIVSRARVIRLIDKTESKPVKPDCFDQKHLDQWMLYSQDLLSKTLDMKYLTALENIFITKEMLSLGVNKKLALENLALTLFNKLEYSNK